MAITETVKFIIAVLIGAAVLFGVQTVLDWREGAQAGEQLRRTATAISGIINDGAEADAQRDTVDMGIARGRDKFNNDYQEAKLNEPETAARAARVVPVSVRNAFRARRLARERSACPDGRCVQGPAPEDATER